MKFFMLEGYKSMTEFHVLMYGKIDDSNGGYHHPTHNMTGVISKDGKTIELTEEEIKKVVHAFGGNFRG